MSEWEIGWRLLVTAALITVQFLWAIMPALADDGFRSPGGYAMVTVVLNWMLVYWVFALWEAT